VAVEAETDGEETTEYQVEEAAIEVEEVDEDAVEEEVDEDAVEEEVDEDAVEEEVDEDAVEEEVDEDAVEEEVDEDAVEEEEVDEDAVEEEEVDQAAAGEDEAEAAIVLEAEEPPEGAAPDLDIGELIQDFVGDDSFEQFEEELTGTADEETAGTDASAEAEADELPDLDDDAEKPDAMPDMALFDEALGAGEGEDILGGDTEATAAEQEAPETTPEPEREFTIPVELDEDQAEPWSELEAPPVPEDLTTLELAEIELPDQADASTADAIDWRTLGRDLVARLGSEEAPAGASDLFYLAGDALLRAGDDDDAVLCFRELLQRDPEQIHALRMLRRLHGVAGAAEQVDEVLEMQAHLARGAELDGIIATRVERLWHNEDTREEALQLTDKLPEGAKLRGLLLRADMAAAAGDREQLEQALEALSAALDGTVHGPALALDRARSLELKGEADEAAQAYAAAAPAEGKLYTGAEEGLLRLAARAGNHEEVISRLQASAGTEPEGPWAGQRLYRAACLARDHEVAGVDFEALIDAAATADADSPLLQQEQTRRIREGAAPEEAVAQLREHAEQAFYPDQKAFALAEAACVAERALGDKEGALELYHEASGHLEEYPPVMLGISRLEHQDGDADARVEALREAAASASPAEQRNLHLQAALELVGQEDREEELLQDLQACLESHAAFRPALELLASHYLKAGEAEALAGCLDEAGEVALNSEDASEYRERAAWLYEGPLALPSRALERYQQLAAAKQDEPAYRAGVRRCLEQMGQVDQLAEELSAQASATTLEPLAARILAQRGGLLASAMMMEDATASYNEAYKRQPGYLPAVYALADGQARDGNWREVARLWTALMEALPETSPRRRALSFKLAALYQTELEDHAGALEIYRELAGGDEPVPGAEAALLRCLEEAGDAAEVASRLVAAADAAGDTGSKVALSVAAATRLEALGGDAEQIEKLLVQAAEADPDSPLAQQAFDRHLRGRGAHDLLAQRAAARLDGDRALEGDELAGHLQQLADIELQLGKEPEALVRMEAALEATPADLYLRRRMQRLYKEQGRHAEALAALRAEAEASGGESSEAGDLLLEIGRRLFFDELTSDDTEKIEGREAAEMFRRAAELHAEDLLPLRYLVDLAWIADRREDLAGAYKRLAAVVDEKREAAILLTRAGEQHAEGDLDLFREALDLQDTYLGAIYQLRDGALKAEQWDAACNAAEAEGIASNDPEHVADAFLLAAEIARRKLEDPDRALAAYQACLASSPDNGLAFRNARALLEQAERWDDLGKLLQQRTQVERSRPRLAELYGAMADLARDHLDDRDMSKRHLRMLVQLDPAAVESLETLAELYYEDEQWSEASHALLSLARNESSHERLKRIFLKLGIIYREKTPDAKRAVASYRKVLALDPANLDALTNLSDLFTSDGQHDQALKVTTMLFERDRDKENKVRHLLRIAKIQEQGMRDAHKASQAYRQAQELAPQDLEVIKELASFFTRQRDQRSLLVHLDSSMAATRTQQEVTPFSPDAYRSLLKILGWRKSPDGRLCVAQVLEALDHGDGETDKLVKASPPGKGEAERYVADPPHDDLLFGGDVPGGFRLVFQMMAENFTKVFKGDLRRYGLGRGDRLSGSHAIKRIADQIGAAMGVPAVDVYLSREHARLLVVENTVPPSILIDQGLVEGAHESEIRFLMGRCLWLIRKSMILPALLKPEDLELLVAAVVRQYQGGYKPAEADDRKLASLTGQVKKLTKKIGQELMPFALECSGHSVKPRMIGASVQEAGNRAGLLTCGSVQAAVAALAKLAGQPPPGKPGNKQLEALLRFAVSDAHFELRRSIGTSIS